MIKTRDMLRMFGRTYAYGARYLPIYIPCALIMILCSFSYSYIPGNMLRLLLDAVIHQTSGTADFIVQAVLWAGAAVLYNASGVLMHAMALRVEASVRGDMLRHCLYADPRVLRRTSGDIIERLVNDSPSFAHQFSPVFLGFHVMTYITGAMAFTVVARINVQLALLALAGGGLGTALNLYFAKRSREIRVHIRSAYSLLTQQYANMIVGYETIQSYVLNTYLQKQARDTAMQIRRWMLKNAMLLRISDAGSRLGAYVASFGVVVYGAALASRGKLYLPDLLLAYTMLLPIGFSLSRMAQCWNGLQSSGVDLSRVWELLDLPMPDDGRPNLVWNDDAPTLEVQGLAFAYEETPVLNNITFTIHKGERVALVGSSGGGKSTLLKLIAGLYPLQGDIRLAGNMLNDVNVADWRGHIAYVPQESAMLNGTIKENIQWGRADTNATVDTVTAATLADADGFIAGLPQAYQTPLGEMGALVSGGQRQRIALARAFYRDAPVLLLDEPTSALDGMTQEHLETALAHFPEKAILFSTHRFSTLRGADRILVMENGCIVEQGTHDELIAYGGAYARMWREQIYD